MRQGKMPKVIYAVENDHDSYILSASETIVDAVAMNTKAPVVVGVYRLVDVRKYIACEAVRRLPMKMEAKP